MPSSIFSSLLSTFDSHTTAEAAARFGLPKATVSQGLESATACLLGGLAAKTNDSNWTSRLFQLVSNAPSTVNVSDLTSAVSDPAHASSATASLLDSGKKFLSLAFGGNQASILDAIGKSTGLRSGAVSSLMTMAAPLIMSALGRLVREDHLNASGLSRLLVNESEGIRDVLPAGVSNLLNATPPSPQVTTDTRPLALGTIPEPAVRSRNWWWLLIPALLIPLAFYWVYRVRHPVVPIVQVNRFIIRTLPGNVSLNIPTRGIESSLLAFIQDPSKTVEPPTWFNFDRLLFDTDSVTLRPESEEQLGDIAAILKAYPKVNIKIGGYTDNTGDPQYNKTLSQQRANSVMARLVADGVSPDRMEAEGYGEQFPVADNSTAEGRTMNRRVALRVTQK